MMLIEVNLILSTLLAEPGRRILNNFHNCIHLHGFALDCLKFLTQLDELQFHLVKDIQLFIVKQFLFVVDPNILEVDVVQIVQNFLYFVLVFEAGNWRKIFVLFVLQVVLTSDGVLQQQSTVFGFEGRVKARFVTDRGLVDSLEVIGDELFILFEVGQLLLKKQTEIVELLFLFLNILKLNPHFKVLLLQEVVLRLYFCYLFFQCLQFLLVLLQLLSLSLQLNAQLLISLFHFLYLSLHGQAILFQYIIINYPLFGLIEPQSSLQFIDDLVLLCHLLGQHFQALLFLLALHLLPSKVFFDLFVRYLLLVFDKDQLLSKFEDPSCQVLQFFPLLPLKEKTEGAIGLVSTDGLINELHLFLLFGEYIVLIANRCQWRTLKEQFLCCLDYFSIDYFFDCLHEEIPLMTFGLQVQRFYLPKGL